MDSHDPAARMRQLIDRAAVLDVVVAYATALDTRDWAGLESLFTDDAEVDYGPSVGAAHGPQAIAAVLRRTLEHLDATQHLMGNSVVRVSGDEASHTGYVQGQHVRRGVPGGDLYLVAGRYEDRLRRTPDGWRFTYRTLVRSWSQGNRAVVHGAP